VLELYLGSRLNPELTTHVIISMAREALVMGEETIINRQLDKSL